MEYKDWGRVVLSKCEKDNRNKIKESDKKKGTDEAEFQSERQAVEGRSSVDNSPFFSPILSTKEALYSSISSP